MRREVSEIVTQVQAPIERAAQNRQPELKDGDSREKDRKDVPRFCGTPAASIALDNVIREQRSTESEHEG